MIEYQPMYYIVCWYSCRK